MICTFHMLALSLSIDFKFVNTFHKKTVYFNIHCNSSLYFNKTSGHSFFSYCKHENDNWYLLNVDTGHWQLTVLHAQLFFNPQLTP